MTSNPSFIPEPSPPTDARPRVFPCEGCGADLEFNIGVQQLKCPYCGFVKSLEFDPDAEVAEQDFHRQLARLAELRDGDRQDEQGLRELRCASCSATVRFSGTLTSQHCPYCGAPLQIENAHEAPHRVPVDGILPFRIDRKAAEGFLAEWVDSRWFAPGDFKSDSVRGRFSGVYLPYWTFDSLTFTRYRGERGEHYWVTVGSGKNRRRVRRTRWYPASGAFQRFFDDLLCIAGTGLPTQRLATLEPWPLGSCVPFNPEVMAGFLARTYDVSLEEGFLDARQRIDEALRADVRRRIGGDEQRIHSVQSRYDAITYKHLLLPVWMLAYRYRDRTFQVVVNATTGEVQGDRPYSWVKILMVVLLAVAAGFAVWLLVQQ